jgi:branched-chain amino acid transport system ATP-binding protein
MSLCQDIHVLAEGEIIARGSPSTVSRDARVIEAYLGHGAAQRLKAAGGADA